MILWISGISGAGKTTLANYFKKKFKFKNKNLIHIDGDEFRKIFSNDLNYSLRDRNKNAVRLLNLVKYLSDQKINLVISSNLTSNKYKIWCRSNFKHFVDVYIKTDIKNLLNRDYKNLYKNALSQKIKNVVGVDIPFKEPKKKDILIENNETKKKFLHKINLINLFLWKKKIKIY